MERQQLNIMLMEEAEAFILSLPEKARKKVAYNINRVRGGEMDKELFKKLEGSNIWEFRTLFNGVKYRLFAFWDENQRALIIATHGFIKKTQKAPQGEIARAEAIRKEYLSKK